MSAKLKKLSTSREDVFLLSETKTWEKNKHKMFEAWRYLTWESEPTHSLLTLVPLNTSFAVFLQASTTPSPFSSIAMTGPLEIRYESHHPAEQQQSKLRHQWLANMSNCTATRSLVIKQWPADPHIFKCNYQIHLISAVCSRSALEKLVLSSVVIIKLIFNFWESAENLLWPERE